MIRKAGVIAAGLVALLVAVGPAASDEGRQAAGREDSILRTASFFSGTVGKNGEFPGKLVCLSCDLHPGPAAAAQCQKTGHRHGLSIDGDPLLHPLIATDEVVLEQVNSNALHGKEVTVSGVYYPATGAILVSGVRAAS